MAVTANGDEAARLEKVEAGGSRGSSRGDSLSNLPLEIRRPTCTSASDGTASASALPGRTPQTSCTPDSAPQSDADAVPSST